MATTIAARGKSAWWEWLVFLLAPLLTAAAIWIVVDRSIPLGLLGEWTWNRMPQAPSPERFLVPLLAVALYGAVLSTGYRILSRARELWIAALAPALLAAAFAMQAAWADLPDAPYGPERWPLSLYHTASSGYFTVARQMQSAGGFLSDYERWIATQDSFHIGTHPPGLFLLNRAALVYFLDHPQAARRCLAWLPARIHRGLDEAAADREILDLPERATLGAMILLAVAASVLTAVPLYLLLRLDHSPSVAWFAAGLWPLAPVPLVFLPISDCLFPLLAVTITALLLWSIRLGTVWLAALAGLILWAGLMLSLAFVAMTPILVGSAMLLAWSEPARIGWRFWATATAFAAGVCLPIVWLWFQFDVNMVTVWQLNLAKHAGFYEAMPRSYVPWIALNLVEFSIAVGPAILLLGAIAVLEPFRRRQVTATRAVHLCWWLTLLALDLSGRNLSEVARLWMFLMPLALVGVARYLSWRLPAWPILVALVACQGLLSTVLVSGIEPLLPIAL